MILQSLNSGDLLIDDTTAYWSSNDTSVCFTGSFEEACPKTSIAKNSQWSIDVKNNDTVAVSIKESTGGIVRVVWKVELKKTDNSGDAAKTMIHKLMEHSIRLQSDYDTVAAKQASQKDWEATAKRLEGLFQKEKSTLLRNFCEFYRQSQNHNQAKHDALVQKIALLQEELSAVNVLLAPDDTQLIDDRIAAKLAKGMKTNTTTNSDQEDNENSVPPMTGKPTTAPLVKKKAAPKKKAAVKKAVPKKAAPKKTVASKKTTAAKVTTRRASAKRKEPTSPTKDEEEENDDVDMEEPPPSKEENVTTTAEQKLDIKIEQETKTEKQNGGFASWLDSSDDDSDHRNVPDKKPSLLPKDSSTTVKSYGDEDSSSHETTKNAFKKLPTKTTTYDDLSSDTDEDFKTDSKTTKTKPKVQSKAPKKKSKAEASLSPTTDEIDFVDQSMEDDIMAELAAMQH